MENSLEAAAHAAAREVGAPEARALSAVVTAALSYLRQGYAPLPLEPRRKKPRGAAWQKTALAAADVPAAFGPSDNLGLLLGYPGGCLVDVDLDCPEALALAPHLLPQTPSMFGRASSPRAHWLYLAPKTKTAQYKDSSVSPPLMLVELRSTGAQTMVPPSLHPDGERVRWEPGAEGAVPSMVEPRELAEAVRKLAVACLLVRHGVPQAEAVACAQGGPLPRAALDGSTRAALALEWLGLAPPPPAKASPAAPPRPAASSIPNDDDELERAAAAYNSAHPLVDLPKSDGDCPICQHKECFGTLAGSNGARWACFSASHPLRAGVRGKGCYHGDAVDLAAHAAGLVGADARAELLRAEGYLAPRAPRTPSLARGAGASSAPPAELAPPAVASPATKTPPTKPGAPRRTKVAAPVDAAPRPPLATTDAQPTIHVQPGKGAVLVDLAIVALAALPSVYVRNRRLVSVAGVTQEEAEKDQKAGIDRPVGSAVIAEIPLPSMWRLMSASAEWVKTDSRKRVIPADPPDRVVKAVHANTEWPGYRRIEGIITSPALRADGSLLDAPGYDRATGLVHVPSGPVAPIPAAPSRADALAALDVLRDCVEDFPFASEADLSAWVAALLTPLARATYVGNTPLFLLDANTPRAGKSRLCDLISLIVSGRPMPRSSFTVNDDEMEKRITAHLLAGDQTVLFDNVSGPLGSAVLDRVLTAEGCWSTRRLGSNDSTARLEVPTVTAWFATSNNAAIAGDLFGRAVHLRLESPLDRPEERSGFRHDPLLPWVRGARPRLLAAALTILRAWFVAGRPTHPMTPFGSFESWSAIIRNVCLFVDLEDPWAKTKERLRRADPGASTHAQLLTALEELDPKRLGLTSGQIKRMVEEDLATTHGTSRQPHYPQALDALETAGVLAQGNVNTLKLSKKFELLKDKRHGGRWFHRETGHASTIRWSVHREALEGLGGVYANTPQEKIHRNSNNTDRAFSWELPARTPPNPSNPSKPSPSLSLAGPSESPSLPPNAGLALPLSGPVAQGADEGDDGYTHEGEI